ncbi:unnamed protein product [Dovyalis caffra]|uniref:BZIP domain-containing protein n=1 Tax=Dovyalis caffra TaxID=77055 RepID=A0AAV1RVK3_9ROSI|nr:unnamed protein product [Dovyalis caffra]
MDDGEVELSNHVLLPNLDSAGSLQCSASVDSLLDEFLKNTRTCTHTHTCNPPGPDAIHSHTCYHTHTQVIASEEDDDIKSREHSNSKAKRPAGNREAVRKYREKKKAHTAYLEEEVRKLRILNQQLVRKIQRQAILEAEVLRLRSILVDLRGKIDTELGVFPFQNQCNTTTVFKEGDCGVQPTGGSIDIPCQTDLPCFQTQVVGSSSQANIGGNGKLIESWEANCLPPIVDCQTNTNNMANGEGHAINMVEALLSSASQALDETMRTVAFHRPMRLNFKARLIPEQNKMDAGQAGFVVEKEVLLVKQSTQDLLSHKSRKKEKENESLLA